MTCRGLGRFSGRRIATCSGTEEGLANQSRSLCKLKVVKEQAFKIPTSCIGVDCTSASMGLAASRPLLLFEGRRSNLVLVQKTICLGVSWDV
jgi:hypothetical protein